jgi:hypothetical protein
LLVLKPLKECSTPPQAQGLLSGIKIPGYPTNDKIRHPARSLKPHRRGPSKTNPPKALTVCQSLVARTTNSIPPEPCEKVSGEMGALGGIFPLCLSPGDVIKVPNPLSLLHLARGTRGTLWQDGEPWGPPTTAPAPADGMDVTMHSQQEHGNHALTQHDPDHSTMMTSIPLQRRG